MVTALYTHPDMLDHEPGRNHKERPERLKAVLGALKDAGGLDLEPRAAPLVTRAELDQLMAVAPLVSWRSADAKVLWGRMRVSAWSAVGAVAVLLSFGVRRPAEVLAVFLSVLAAGAALRTLRGALVAAIRRGSWRSVLRSTTTGGMIVHLGVVILALGIVTSTTLRR